LIKDNAFCCSTIHLGRMLGLFPFGSLLSRKYKFT
jgi:hypothetical protein